MDKSIAVGFGGRNIPAKETLKLQVKAPGFFRLQHLVFSDLCKGLLINSLIYESFERLPPNKNQGAKVATPLIAEGKPIGVDLFEKLRFSCEWMMPGYFIEMEIFNPTSLDIYLEGAVIGEIDTVTTAQIKLDAKRDKEERAEESRRLSPGC